MGSLSWVTLIEPTVWDGESWTPVAQSLLNPEWDDES